MLELTEDQLRKLGLQVVSLMNLKNIGSESMPRYKTSYGDKSPLGLAAVIVRLINEVTE